MNRLLSDLPEKKMLAMPLSVLRMAPVDSGLQNRRSSWKVLNPSGCGSPQDLSQRLGLLQTGRVFFLPPTSGSIPSTARTKARGPVVGSQFVRLARCDKAKQVPQGLPLFFLSKWGGGRGSASDLS